MHDWVCVTRSAKRELYVGRWLGQDLNKAIDEISGNWADSPPDFKFLPCDLLPFPASVKHMNLIGAHIEAPTQSHSLQRLTIVHIYVGLACPGRVVDIAEANAMFYTSLDEKGTDQARLLKLGLIKYQVPPLPRPW